MTTKLKLYNAALREVGKSKLSALTEAREDRYVLDDVYEDVIRLCLELGQWKGATKTVEVEASASIEPTFGYEYAFPKPSDWIRTTALSADENLSTPLLEYKDENGYWLARVKPLYVSYVSDDVEFGLDLSSWPPSFSRYAELSLAYRIAARITENESMRDRIAKDLKIAKSDAQSMDAMNGPTAFAQTGAWVQARVGSGFRKYNRA